MADRTAAKRVGRYRASHHNRGVGRVELVAPLWAIAPLKEITARMRQKARLLDNARPALEAVLTTVNAPRPRHLDPETLMACILSPVPLEVWQCHMQSLFDEVPVEALHRVVLSGVVDFEDLNRAARVWEVPDGDVRKWVAEMADFRLARPAAKSVAAD